MPDERSRARRRPRPVHVPSAELDRIGDAAAELVSEAVAAGRLPRSPSAELMALAGGMVLSARAAAR